MIKTDICDLLQIEYPIFQGGMAWLGTAELASAVSEAGGLGIIGAGHMPPDVFRNEIHKVKERTSKPFGCNIMLMSPFVKEVMEVVVEERVPVITTGAGNPGVYIPALKEIGTKVIPVVASVLLAKRLLRGGIDALIAEGTESGGHVGDYNNGIVTTSCRCCRCSSYCCWWYCRWSWCSSGVCTRCSCSSNGYTFCPI